MKTFLGLSITWAAALLACNSANAALGIYADFNGDSAHDATTSIAPGTAFTMRLFALEDGLHGGLTSYGIELMLEPTLAIDGVGAAAQLANIVSDPLWDLPESKSVAPVEVIDGSLFTPFSGVVHLANVTLRAPVTPGMYTVSFKNIEPDLTFDGFVGFDGFVYDPSNDFKSSVVTVVPEPATAGMLALGIAMLGWMRRRRRLAR